MRYFKTSNASRPYNAGGFAFTFEPVDQFGGNWLGVLALEDDSSAGILVSGSFPQVSEITAEQYDVIKKKPLSRNSSSYELQPPPAPVSLPAPVVQSAETEVQESPKPDEVKLPDPVAELLDLPDELPTVDVVKPINKPARRTS